MSFSQSFRELNDWANSVPPITRFLVFGTVVLSLAAQFGVCHPRQLVLSFPYIYTKYEIWRLLTCHLFSRGQAIIWHLIMLYQQSLSLEQGHFSSKPYEYAWAIILIMAVLDVIGVYMSLPILTDTFGLAVTTLYSLVKGDEVVSFMFGLQFKAIFLPW
ncbi:Derlin 1, partial [Boothiomyces sp. JEL0866]